jgi:AhpD family alkylhydroperoxidase
MMTPRLNLFTAGGAALQAWVELAKTSANDGLEPKLKELVTMRISQINGCAFCLHFHLADARKAGESEDRLHLLSAWREPALYSDRERAALGWTEALTLIAQTHAPDEAYEELRRHFSDEEQVKLTSIIGQTNAWNRFNIGFRSAHPAEAQKKAA